MSLKSFLYLMIATISVMGITYYDFTPSVSADSFANTFKSFSVTCTKCHEMRNPKKYEKATWIFNVKRMSKRAKITSSQKKAIIGLWEVDGISKKVAKWNNRHPR